MKYSLVFLALIIGGGVFLGAIFNSEIDQKRRAQISRERLSDLRLTADLNGLATPDVLVGDSAPDTKSRTIKGDQFDLADHQDKLVFVSFFGAG